MIPVTKPFLPPIEEYNQYLQGIWQRQWLTNNGPLVNELEIQLKTYLDVLHLLYLSNGTIALQIAFKALALEGEVITTPFSYVATTSSLVWEGLSPVFVDIDSKTFNIDPSKIEAAITSKTSAILATHVYGNPCDIDAIQAIADKYQLKVIYDAAHCFGTTYKGKSVLVYGDISTISFHATKLFHTTEGGAVFSMSSTLIKKMSSLRNFGHAGATSFDEVGINGKNSEFHAAMGLCNLKYIDAVIGRRREQYLYYLQQLRGLKAQYLTVQPESEFNYAYFPIVFQTEKQLLASVELLNGYNVYPRRYFYPSLTDLPYLKPSACEVCSSIAPRVLCLPLYHQLSSEEQDMICRILLRIQNN